MGYEWREAEADRACRFFEEYVRHVKGEWAGQPFELEEWQKEQIIRPLFGWYREDGTRRYRRCYVEIPRKNGKSTLAAGIALYLLLADKEPGAEVYSAAADRDQARIVFDVASGMVDQHPKLRSLVKTYRTSLTVPKTGSYYKVLSADAFTKHGLNAHGVVFDELHAQKTRDLWDVLCTSVGARRQPLIFAITTAGVYDPESICWEVHDHATKVAEGIVEDDEFLPVIFGAEKEDDWTDPAIWAKANPGLGVTVKPEYLRAECNRAKEVPAAQNTFRRLHLNQWTEQVTRWLDMSIWDENAGEVSESELIGRKCYGGLDLSSTSDLSALVLVFPDDNEPWKILARFWCPGEKVVQRSRRDRVPYDAWVRDGHMEATDGDSVNYKAIRQAVNEAVDLFNVQEIAYDRWNATQLVTQLTEDDGIGMVDFGQGYASMSAPTKELEKFLLDRKLNHGGHPVLRWNAANVAVKQDAAGNIKPAKDKSTEKIDGIVALVMAIGLASAGHDMTSKYETGDLLVL